MRALVLLAVLSLGLAACGVRGRASDAGLRPPDSGAVDAGASDAGPPPTTITRLEEVVDDAGVRAERYRLQRGDAAAGYAQWYPPPADGGAAPVIVLTKPYAGIDWTGEAVDERWAARGPGQHPDEDGPAFDPETSSSIAYDPLTLAEANDEVFLWQFHGFGVLMLFGRFYAGGDVANDIEDMTMGFDFLAAREDVDEARVGIFGGSWGGFLALYGAAYARADLAPAAGVALYPLSDFEAERRFANEVLPQRYTRPQSRAAAAAFFEPYLRRIDATVVRNSGFEGLRAEDVAARIDAPFLIVHEDWDTLVPIEQSERLVELAPETFAPLWLQHEGPPEPWDEALNTHGPLLAGGPGLGIYTFVWAHLLTRLGGPAQPLTVPWDRAGLRALLELMHARQAEGRDVAFLAPQLALLCDPRVQTFALDDGSIAPGPETLALELEAVWGASWTAEAACRALTQGNLPPS